MMDEQVVSKGEKHSLGKYFSSFFWCNARRRSSGGERHLRKEVYV